MSTKNKKIVYYLAAFLVVLMLVCTCLLGNTFARYVSSGTGTGKAEVAKWSLTESKLSAAASQTITYSKLSPSQIEYNSTSASTPTTLTEKASGYNDDGYRYKASEWVEVIIISNTSDVKATVTATTSNKTLTNNGGSVPANYDATNAAGCFDVKLYYTTDSLTTKTALPDAGVTIAASTGTMTVYALFIWTSYDNNSASDGNGDAADKLDTAIGEYITSVSWDLTWNAVQASEMPASD